jgi:hypothetical protein
MLYDPAPNIAAFHFIYYNGLLSYISPIDRFIPLKNPGCPTRYFLADHLDPLVVLLNLVVLQVQSGVHQYYPVDRDM